MNGPPSPRTGTAGTSSWRRSAPPAATTTPRRACSTRPRRSYRRGFYPDVRPIAALRARVQIAAGDLSSAGGWAEDRAVSVDDEPDYLREYEHLTLARLLLAARTDRHDRSACSVFSTGCMPRRWRLGGTAACGRSGCCRPWPTMPAVTSRRRSPHSAEASSTRRSRTATCGCTWTRAPRCWPSCTTPPADATAAQARRLLERATTSVEAAAEPQQTLGDALSHRELQVLRLLDSELTGPEIARELYVTLNTLRTHTKRIFTKLDVTTRAAAVRRAHERGLLLGRLPGRCHIVIHIMW